MLTNMLHNWIFFLFSIITLLIGIVLIKSRRSIAKLNASLQRSAFGKAGEPYARASTPGSVIAVACFFIVMGVVLLWGSIVGH